MIQKFKRAINKIKSISKPDNGMTERTVPESRCMGSVDFFDYQNHILYVEGWVFDPVCAMENQRISFYREGCRIGSICASVAYRKDVAEVLKNPRAESCGFFFEVTVKTQKDLDVFFEYDTNAGSSKFFLGKISGDNAGDGETQIVSHERYNCIGNIRYVSENTEHMEKDNKKMQLFSVLQKLEQKEAIPTILAFDHLLGGGATAYLEEKRKNALKEGYRFLILRQDMRGPTYYLTYEYQEYHLEYYERELDEIFQHIHCIDEIWVNELVTYVNPYKILKIILEMKQKFHAYLKMLLHDYYSMCPAINLMNHRGVYCHGASEKICDQCIPDNRSNACPEYESGSIWRKNWGDFLEECDEVCAFSNDTARLFQQVYPTVLNLTVNPHKPHTLPPVNKRKKTTDTFNIGLLGVLCFNKGLEVVKKLVRYIEENDLNVRVKLIGVSDEEIDSPFFSSTGRYVLDQLPGLTMENDIDVFLIASIWPETFSYTTSEIISMGMPVAVFPIGAPAERVKEYDRGIILSGMEPETIMFELKSFAEKILPYKITW